MLAIHGASNTSMSVRDTLGQGGEGGGGSVPALEFTILMPCLNEARTVGVCIQKALGYLRLAGVSGEVVVADNGSTDGSQRIAQDLGARVVDVSERGYGAALRAGIQAARGRYVIMADSDDSYDFSALRPFVDKLREGYDLVMGNRFEGAILPGAMPPLHRYLGNPVLTGIGRMLFRAPIGDFHCGLRGFNKAAIERLNLTSSGMEFASEMVVKASLHRLSMKEVPVTLSPDGRDRAPHLRSWRDGWRHLRFLLLLSPRWLFLYPGLALFALGMGGMAWLLPGGVQVANVVFDIHTLLYCSAGTMAGLQLTLFAILMRCLGAQNQLLPANAVTRWFMESFRLEVGLLMALLLCLGAIGIALQSLLLWQHTAFHDLNPSVVMRHAIPAVTMGVAGIELMMFSFFITFLQFNKK